MGRYRRTSRRQRRRPLSWSPGPQRRHSIAWPVLPAGDGVARFLLPGKPSLIAPGRHRTVVVTPAGFKIAGRSREHVVHLAAEFFATVARDRTPFAVAAVIGDRAKPAEHDVYQLAVVAGDTIVARSAMEPAIIAPGSLTVGGEI